MRLVVVGWHRIRSARWMRVDADEKDSSSSNIEYVSTIMTEQTARIVWSIWLTRLVHAMTRNWVRGRQQAWCTDRPTKGVTIVSSDRRLSDFQSGVVDGLGRPGPSILVPANQSWPTRMRLRKTEALSAMIAGFL